jgi:alkanesulfonate monooxygenase SsuD/methylene tetrahydromethanopterin reductase-like flavin-dependent oxidoreductase (luciferase family)
VQLQPPVDSMDALWSPLERMQVEHVLREAIVGGPDALRLRLEAFIARTGADELMITSHIHDHTARVRSYDIVSSLW